MEVDDPGGVQLMEGVLEGKSDLVLGVSFDELVLLLVNLFGLVSLQRLPDEAPFVYVVYHAWTGRAFSSICDIQ